MTSTMHIKIIEDVVAGAMQDNWDPVVPSTNPNNPEGGFASGGNLGSYPTNAIAEVGEEGAEFVINGMVIPAPITRWLKAAGMRAGKKFGTGGPLIDGIYDISSGSAESYSSYQPPTYGAGGVGVAGTASDPAYSPTAEVAAAEATAETAQRSTQAAVNTVTTRMTQTIEAGQDESSAVLKNIYAVLRDQPTQDGLTTAMKSAVQEALAQ